MVHRYKFGSVRAYSENYERIFRHGEENETNQPERDDAATHRTHAVAGKDSGEGNGNANPERQEERPN